MTNEELQEQIRALSQQQLALAEAVNQLGTLFSTGGTALDAGPESSEDFISALEYFTTRSPSRNYKNYARTRGRWLFRVLASPAALASMREATAMGFPAVAGIAESVVHLSVRRANELTAVDRQFIGSVACHRMEANGYRKAEKKGPIPHEPFTRGQLYEQIAD